MTSHHYVWLFLFIAAILQALRFDLHYELVDAVMIRVIAIIYSNYFAHDLLFSY